MTVLVIRPVGFLIAGLILCLGKVSHSGLKLLRSGSELELTNLKLENELAAEKEAYTCTRAHTIDSLQGGLPQLLQAVIALSDVEDEVYDRLISTLQMLHLQVIYPPPSCWLGFYYLLVTK
uniref:Uncharacterized protein n=2 Tax=Physcomitrium patens TaxID=3218 RepID=A0A2K1KNM9_PHYPA|nr:hypothetical protein PHYPA_006277 [Physcomitrium patens]